MAVYSFFQILQRYRVLSTVLDVPVVERAWLHDQADGNPTNTHAPGPWSDWVRKGRYRALTAESTTVVRDQQAQLPDSPVKTAILKTVWEHFKDARLAFEAFAARVLQMHDQRVIIDEVTRAAVDGGRDAVGRYLLGLSDDPVYAEFSLEAKCYRPPLNGLIANTVGVKDVSRLISRIRHRQFGVMVTTSVIGRQAYEEVREDRHPIIFLSGKFGPLILAKRKPRYKIGRTANDPIEAFNSRIRCETRLSICRSVIVLV